MRKFTAVIAREEDWYVAHCIELGVVSQGHTIEEAQANLKEAVELYLESFGELDGADQVGEVKIEGEDGQIFVIRPERGVSELTPLDWTLLGRFLVHPNEYKLFLSPLFLKFRRCQIPQR